MPLGRLASFLRRLCAWLVIEFVPKSDLMVDTLLGAREGVFPDYTRRGFEAVFDRWFTIPQCEEIGDSGSPCT